MKRNNFINRGQRLSPSARKIIKLRSRAFANGGASLELQIPTNYIRDISRKLNYDITTDASLIMTPNTIGEGKLFNVKPELKNQLRYSEDYTNSVWTKNLVTVTQNANLNAFGNNKSYYIVDNATNSGHYLNQNSNLNSVNIVSGFSYTASYYIKKADFDWIQLTFPFLGFGNCFVNFNLNTGAFGIQVGTIAKSVISLGNGWYQVALTATATGNWTGSSMFIISSNNTNTSVGAPSYAGTGSNIIDVCAMQFEQGLTATTYQSVFDGITDFQATRATTATVVQKDGSVGDSCYNLLQNSDNYNTGTWTKFATSVTLTSNQNPVTKTVGTFNVLESTVNSSHILFDINPTNSGVTYTNFYVLKKIAHDWIQIITTGSFSLTCWVNFNLTTGQFGNSGGGFTSFSSEDLGNGWFKIYTTATATSTNPTGGLVAIATTNNTNAASRALSYAGSNTNVFEIAVTQSVAGLQPRDYLKTTNRFAVPSIDYSLGASLPALLVEPQRTNLTTFSQDFGNSIWTLFNATKSSVSSSTSPTAVSYFFNDGVSAGVNHYVYHNGGSTYTSGNTYTASFFVKKAAHSYMLIGFTSSFDSANPGAAIFNFDSEVFTNSQNIISSKVEKLVNGWYRISITKAAALTNNTSAIYVASTNNTNSFLPTYTGTNSNYVEIGGAQFELGNNATSYIPTTTAAVTRNAYTSFVDLFNNSLLNKDNFTLYFEGYLQDGTSTNVSVALSDTTGTGTRANDLGIIDGIKASYCVGGTITSDSSSLSNNTNFKFCIQRNGTNVSFYRNGIQIWVTQTIPVFDYRYLVVNSGGSTYSLNKIALWKTTKSDADCVLLTT